MSHKPFPWKCSNCGNKSVVETTGPFSAIVEHDGIKYQIEIPELSVPRCTECGEGVLDDVANRKISERLRELAGLLTAEQIRANRETLGMTPGDLASRLGVPQDVLERLEMGWQIQERAVDRLLRLYFESSSVRCFLAEESNIPLLGIQPHNVGKVG